MVKLGGGKVIPVEISNISSVKQLKTQILEHEGEEVEKQILKVSLKYFVKLIHI